jgi:hypothetical protein
MRDATIGTKPGRASTRRNQACTCGQGARSMPPSGACAVFHAVEQQARDGVGLRVVRPAEDRLHARRRGPGRQRARRHAEPALHRRLRCRVRGQPAACGVVARGQVDQDRVAVGQRVLAVLDHRHLAEGVQRQERRRLVRAARQVDLDQGAGQVQQREHELHAVRVAREGKAVQADRWAHGGLHWQVGRMAQDYRLRAAK